MNTKLDIQIKKGLFANTITALDKQEALDSLKAARALTAEMVKMIDENSPCVDIMEKNLIAVAYLRHAQQMIVQGNLSECFKKATNKNSDENKKIREEMLKVIKMFYK